MILDNVKRLCREQLDYTTSFCWLTSTQSTRSDANDTYDRKEAAARLGMSLPTLDLERTTGRLAYIQRNTGETSSLWTPCRRGAGTLKRL